MATLAQKVRFLSDRRSYPHRPEAVEPIETHMSWVFLAGNRVYKFKKPVTFPFLDFSTLAARQINCTAEHQLNQRLAADTYRRVVPLTEDPSGGLRIDGSGKIVEWLVDMERLPKASMLDVQLSNGTVRREDIAAMAEKLALFYKNCQPQIADGPLYLMHLVREHAVNRKLLTRPEFGLADDGALAALDEVDQLLEVVRPEIERRIADGHLVEGHGDLRPEHVCLNASLQIIDCLEFDRSMRILDPYDEMNYLGLECEFLGAGWIHSVLLDTLDAHLDARPSPALMSFYSAFRAVLRARICVAHLLDATPATPEVWPGRARSYLDMAHEEYVRFRALKGDGWNRRREGA